VSPPSPRRSFQFRTRFRSAPSEARRVISFSSLASADPLPAATRTCDAPPRAPLSGLEQIGLFEGNAVRAARHPPSSRRCRRCKYSAVSPAHGVAVVARGAAAGCGEPRMNRTTTHRGRSFETPPSRALLSRQRAALRGDGTAEIGFRASREKLVHIALCSAVAASSAVRKFLHVE